MSKTVDVKKIMGEIQQEIKEKGLKDDLPAFDEVTKAEKIVSETDIGVNVSGMHLTWNIPYDYPIEKNGIKGLGMKIVRKLIKFYIVRVSEKVSEFNGFSTRAMSEMLNQLQLQQDRIFELEERIQKLENND